ncbi:tyrosine--tRNA ligase [Candidatus Woesearchaeota archaeon]|nr:tyrosine--tRNA ligase [Candidatus Woesearchaeota archaeon]
MDSNTSFSLIKEVGQEIITEDELKELLKSKKQPTAYDGFEPSGRMHLAQGLMRAKNINKLIKAGVRFKMLIADWFAFLNGKYGGDMEKINIAGDYFVEMWKACGLDSKNIEIIKTSQLIKDQKYWELVMKIATMNSVQRITRCSQIMGRSESESLSAAQIIYPCMQVADIFYLNADIVQLGMDQRKVNVLAREIAEKLGRKKPIVVSHHMLAGLSEPPKDLTGAERAMVMKMSKSKPDTAIFMDDTKEDVERKIGKAYCPTSVIEENPIMEYAKYIVFENVDKLKIERAEKFGGNILIKSYEELENIYRSGKLHPMDLKKAIANEINKLLEPIRKHFSSGKAKQLMEKVKSFSTTG